MAVGAVHFVLGPRIRRGGCRARERESGGLSGASWLQPGAKWRRFEGAKSLVPRYFGVSSADAECSIHHHQGAAARSWRR